VHNNMGICTNRIDLNSHTEHGNWELVLRKSCFWVHVWQENPTAGVGQTAEPWSQCWDAFPAQWHTSGPCQADGSLPAAQ